jgi:hypothetical protein
MPGAGQVHPLAGAVTVASAIAVTTAIAIAIPTTIAGLGRLFRRTVAGGGGIF